MQMLNKFVMVSQTLSSSSKAKLMLEKIFCGELFIHFALIMGRKRTMSQLHWALCLHSTRFFLLNNNLDNIIIAIYDDGFHVRSCWCTEK